MATLEELKLQIKNTVDLKEFLETYGITFKAQTGNSYVALCPFHNEKTPSFRVNSNYQNYKCFGCGVSGDIFTFIQEKESVNWKESVLFIADSVGIKYDLDEGDTEQYSKLTRAYFIIETLHNFFVDQFNKLEDYHPAKLMVTKRNLNYTSASYGYAPENPKDTLDFLHKKGITNNELKELGLLNNNYFQQVNRLTFTFFNYMGKPIGFTGRALTKEDEKTRKYVNSSNSIIYNKKNVVYNIDKAKKIANKVNCIFLVEGQFDVAAMTEKGYGNTVAISGTAFTEEHLKDVIRPMKDGRIILLLDNDKAGNNAAQKIFNNYPQIQEYLYIITLPDKQDPCDYLMNYTELPKPISYMENKYIEIRNQFDFNSIESKNNFIKQLQSEFTQYIANKNLKEQYLRRACIFIGVNFDELKILTAKNNLNNETLNKAIVQQNNVNNSSIIYYLQAVAIISKYKDFIEWSNDVFPTEFHNSLNEIKNKDKILLESYNPNSNEYKVFSTITDLSLPDLDADEINSYYLAIIKKAHLLDKQTELSKQQAILSANLESMNNGLDKAKLVDSLDIFK